ncbi:MAG: histidinol-phosphate transaminase [Synergistaceae bacterium]|nr:histidinol-phosphate transaminase [Synergistaceae bacterium]
MKKNAKRDTTDFYFKRLARSHILALEPYSPGMVHEDAETVRISANENGFGAPPAVIEALKSRMMGDARLHRYPDITCTRIREALSEKYRFPPDWFLLGNGLDDVINMIALSFLSPNDSVIIPAATFSAYTNASRMMGASPIIIPMRPDMSIDLDATADAIKSNTKIIFLCSPNNPTGTTIKRNEFDSFLEKLAHMPAQPILLVDHAYVDFDRPAGDSVNAIKYMNGFTNLAVLRTFSKLSGLAGLRAGYIIARPSMLSYIYRVRPPYTVNSIAQESALIDLTDESVKLFKDNARGIIIAGRERLEDFLKDSGITYVPSKANFVFAFYDKPYEEHVKAANELAKRGILVRALKHDKAPSGLRFSIGTTEENEKLIAALKEIISAGIFGK